MPATVQPKKTDKWWKYMKIKMGDSVKSKNK